MGERKHGPNRNYNDLVPLSEAKEDGRDHDQTDHESHHPYNRMDVRSICGWRSIARRQTKCDGDDEAVRDNE